MVLRSQTRRPRSSQRQRYFGLATFGARFCETWEIRFLYRGTMKSTESPKDVAAVAKGWSSRDVRILFLIVVTFVLIVVVMVPLRTNGGMAFLNEKPQVLDPNCRGGLGGPECAQEAYWQRTSESLSRWRGGLFPRMAALYRESTQCNKTACPKKPTEPLGHNRFSLFQPFVDCPPGMPLKRWGAKGDGGKWLCGVEVLKEGCVILSLGSNGHFDFEDAMLENTPCEVHTFDCTYDGASRGPRHRYHKQCLGSPEKGAEDPAFITLAHAVRDNEIKEVSLLKMDIEGFEYDVMSLWQDSDPLPAQVSFELHYGGVYDGTWPGPKAKTVMWSWRDVSLSELVVFMSHLAELGYAIINKEDNPLCRHCSEFTLIRVRR
ncbi:hypothetical protein KFL_002180150 [Klebsormidium nitens]|uniref:Methyltransferase domain-containing protein n=1 Tax=Klebsormidium nitens TaxID=105231 RepID=A0A1Y1I283_KLENI|nr:hypothetical protein KFL_002180150 [Klebsormidium nitens]|eukprot:GAQ85040.1 hypothetical protein KFL_002180150 [Klebsormidium nitens]